jgi:hypothetical protein
VGFDGGAEMFSSLESKETGTPLAVAEAFEQAQPLCAHAGWAVPPQPQVQLAWAFAAEAIAFEQAQALWAQAG